MYTTDVISLQKNEVNKNVIVNLYDNYKFIKDYENLNDFHNLLELQKYNYGIVDKNTFIKKFNLCTIIANKIITNKIFETDATNFVFAGGGVFNILANYNSSGMDNSDIDIFFFGDFEQQKISMKKFMNIAKNDFCGEIFKLNDTNVYEIHIPFHKKIQLIPTRFSNKFDIIRNFDLDYLKVFVDTNQDVFCTLSCLYSYKYWATCCTEINDKKQLFRCKKTLNKGMRLITLSSMHNIMNNEYIPIKPLRVNNIDDDVINYEDDYLTHKSHQNIQELSQNTQILDITKILFVNTNKEKYGFEIYKLCENRYNLCQQIIPMTFYYKMEFVSYVLYSDKYGLPYYEKDNTCILIKLQDENKKFIQDILNIEKTNNNIMKNNYLLAKFKNDNVYINDELYIHNNYNMYNSDENKTKFYSKNNVLYKYRNKLCNIHLRFILMKNVSKGTFINAVVTLINNSDTYNNCDDK